jgi:hypothetical protein
MNKKVFKVVFRVDVELMTLQHKLIVYRIDTKYRPVKKILKFINGVIGVIRMGPNLVFKYWVRQEMYRWKSDHSIVMDINERPDMKESYKAVFDLMKDRDDYFKHMDR